MWINFTLSSSGGALELPDLSRPWPAGAAAPFSVSRLRTRGIHGALAERRKSKRGPSSAGTFMSKRPAPRSRKATNPRSSSPCRLRICTVCMTRLKNSRAAVCTEATCSIASAPPASPTQSPSRRKRSRAASAASTWLSSSPGAASRARAMSASRASHRATSATTSGQRPNQPPSGPTHARSSGGALEATSCSSAVVCSSAAAERAPKAEKLATRQPARASLSAQTAGSAVSHATALRHPLPSAPTMDSAVTAASATEISRRESQRIAFLRMASNALLEVTRSATGASSSSSPIGKVGDSTTWTHVSDGFALASFGVYSKRSARRAILWARRIFVSSFLRTCKRFETRKTFRFFGIGACFIVVPDRVFITTTRDLYYSSYYSPH
mmetsp:Transcript_21399/g.48299  ORF Transcript_21399/g.48299 Transcript_21399/m.48299 type:complete len:384 (+) Transcript_21399:842-1993(+)